MKYSKDEIAEKLSLVSIFEGLDRESLRKIGAVTYYKEFSSNQVMVFENDPDGNTLFVIVSGVANVTVVTSEGKQTILASLEEGDFFGEMSVLDGEPRSASVSAKTTCGVFMLHRKDFVRILEEEPKIAISMLVVLSERLRHSNRHINTLSLMSIYGRVADYILKLCDSDGEYKNGFVIINNPPTHQVIADTLGTSRETVSRVLSQLRKKKYILTNRQRWIVLDEEKLYY